MRIAQVAPLYEAVPPQLYGGTERIVSFLTEGLVRRGHQVTLFASGESATSARLVAARPRALRLDPGLQSAIAAHLAMLSEVRRRADEFDVIHLHLSHFIHFPVLSDIAEKTVTTPHGRLDYADLPGAYACWPYFPMISISMRQRQPLRNARWVGNVYHGLPLELFPRRRQRRGDYLAFLGRMSRDKRPDRAIEIARRAGMKLKIAAKIGEDDDHYFKETIKPLLGPNVEFIGEVNDEAKVDFLSNAAALLFPIDWPEPFGLVVIEAMAFGVPVVAWREGAMPEIVDEGETGFVVDTIETAVDAVGRCAGLDRNHIREVFERRFSAERMVSDYEAIYRTLTDKVRGEARNEKRELAGTLAYPDRF
jgi:glycosyltransferase involved in cell wall biosynthesis